MCNREVKFGVFYRYAIENGASYIATGHYAQTASEQGSTLLKGKDAAKDQSYFLWAVEKEALRKTIFPVGELPKERVRLLAKKYDLPVATKKDSQGICFLGSISVPEFLRSEFGTAEGRAVDSEGREIGRHDGVLLSTLGERITLQNATAGPWFVLAKDVAKNEIVIGRSRLQQPSTRREIKFSDANWFVDAKKVSEAQTRYHGPILSGRIHGDVFVPDCAPGEPAAGGQSIVFYAGEEVVGGAIIKS